MSDWTLKAFGPRPAATATPDHDEWEATALERDAIVTRDPRTGIYRMGAPGSRSRCLAAHEATGFYASGEPRPRKVVPRLDTIQA